MANPKKSFSRGQSARSISSHLRDRWANCYIRQLERQPWQGWFSAVSSRVYSLTDALMLTSVKPIVTGSNALQHLQVRLGRETEDVAICAF